MASMIGLLCAGASGFLLCLALLTGEGFLTGPAWLAGLIVTSLGSVGFALLAVYLRRIEPWTS
jgi:hypothetical protein